jgi:hypothetical protein
MRFFLKRQHSAYSSHFSCYAIVTSSARQCRQLSFLPFILLISLPSSEPKLLLLLEMCGNASLQHSRCLTLTTMAVFCSFHPRTHSISLHVSSSFLLPRFFWAAGHIRYKNLHCYSALVIRLLNVNVENYEHCGLSLRANYTDRANISCRRS